MPDELLHAARDIRVLGCTCDHCASPFDEYVAAAARVYTRPAPTTMPGDLEPMYPARGARPKLPLAIVRGAQRGRFMVGFAIGLAAGSFLIHLIGGW